MYTHKENKIINNTIISILPNPNIIRYREVTIIREKHLTELLVRRELHLYYLISNISFAIDPFSPQYKFSVRLIVQKALHN